MELLEDRTAPASFQGLGELAGGDFKSVPWDVSDDGKVVVGYSISNEFWPEAFRWTAEEGMVGLGMMSPEHMYSQATGVSADGSVVVGQSNSHAFRWTTDTKMVGTGQLPGHEFGSANAVSAGGIVMAGTSSVQPGPMSDPSAPSSLAFRATVGGQPTSLGAVDGYLNSSASAISADGSVVVGFSWRDNSPNAPMVAFRWTAQEMLALGSLQPDGIGSQAWGVSPNGSVVVGEIYSSRGREAFRWDTNRGMVGLGGLSEDPVFSVAYGASAGGAFIVGTTYSSADSDNIAFIWDQKHQMRSLRQVLVDEHGLGSALTGWVLKEARAITPDGRSIVGWGYNPAGNLEGWIASLDPLDVKATSLTWNTGKDGGVDFSYRVNGGKVAEDIPVAFYWANGPDFATNRLARVEYFTPTAPETGFSPDESGNLLYTIPAGTAARDTPYTVHVPGRFLKGSPEGTTHLLVAVDPDNTLENFDPRKNVQAMHLTFSVPPLYQNQGPWAVSPGYLLGHSRDKTIDSHGCALTTLVMSLNYAGVTTDPIQLNRQLTISPNGYTGQADLNWGPATAIAAFSAGQPEVQWHPVITSDAQELRDLITSNAAPVVVRVNNPSPKDPAKTSPHFVLVTGLGGDTFTINDPGYPGNPRTSLDAYSNTFETRGYVKDPPDDLSQLYIASSSTSSNLNLAVSNPQGQTTGFPAGSTSSVTQIPNSVYFVDGPLEDLTGENPGNTTTEFVYITRPLGGVYRIEMSGEGSYTMTAGGVSSDGRPQTATLLSGSSSPGVPSQHNVEFNPQPLPPPFQAGGQAASPTSAPPAVAQPVFLGLGVRRQRKSSRMTARVALDGGAPRDVVSPFQKPTFSAIAATLVDLNGDGLFDAVSFTARKGKKSVRKHISL